MPRLEDIAALESLREELAKERGIVRAHIDHVRRNCLPGMRLPTGSRGHGRRDPAPGAQRQGATAPHRLPRVLRAGPVGHHRPRGTSSTAISARKTCPTSSPGPWRSARSSPSFCIPTRCRGKWWNWKSQIPFYAAQERCLLGDNRRLAPTSIEDYIAVGGYAALAKVLTTMAPEAVIEEITASGLRGRGGRRYPTGKKWAQTRMADGEARYVICNADEGDPGAYMDRSVLEGNPHSVLEGMLIGAYAIGAQKGYVYVRNEYPLAVTHIRLAIEQAREYGLLGENILGTELQLRRRGGPRRRGLRVRRVDRADGLSAGRGRRAPGQRTSTPWRSGYLGSAHRPQQRGDVGQHPADHLARARPGSPPRGPSRARAPRSLPSPAR